MSIDFFVSLLKKTTKKLKKKTVYIGLATTSIKNKNKKAAL
jgi:hypothetical protein